jgi:hypothetical protein
VLQNQQAGAAVGPAPHWFRKMGVGVVFGPPPPLRG